jgi:hypothetical protein
VGFAGIAYLVDVAQGVRRVRQEFREVYLVGWQIEGDPTELDTSKDASVWQFELRETPHISKRTRVELSGTAAAIADAEGDLPEDVTTAFRSQGRSAVDATLDWAEPPDTIVISTSGIETVGGIDLRRVSHLLEDPLAEDVRCTRCGKRASQVEGYSYVRRRVNDDVFMRRVRGRVEVFFDSEDEVPAEFAPCRS